MKIRTLVVLVGFVCSVSVLAFGDSIPVTGSAEIGFGIFNGDFNITGPNLTLNQVTPSGPNTIGLCNVGAVCNFNLTIGSTAGFCTYCTGFSSGTFGNKTAQFLDASLKLIGSALYAGGSSLSVPLTITGTIVGYELVGCNPDGSGCSLGPKEFTLYITAHGTGQALMGPDGTQGVILGLSTNLTGIATTVPEPISLLLTGTGMVGVWITKRSRSK